MKARRQQAGEWRARQVAKTPKREQARASVARGEFVEWLRLPRSTRTVAAKRSNFKCGASLNLAIIDDRSPWSADIAAASIFELADLNTPWADSVTARKGFLIYDASAPHLKGSYRFPFARIIGGVLTADREGVEQAARDLAKADLPDGVREKARAVVTRYRVGD